MAKYLLKDTVVLELFKRTFKENPEGYLLFEKENEWRKVFFKDGLITSVSSSSRSDYLGQYLISFGAINIDQFNDAYRMEFETRECMDAVLGHVSSEDLKQLIYEKVINTIFVATRWPEGVYSVVHEKQMQHYNVDVALSINDIRLGLKDRMLEFQDILSSIPKLGARPKIDYMESRGFEISHQKETILNYIIAGKTISEILSIMPAHNYLLLKCIYKLVRMGIIVKGTGVPLSEENIIDLVNNSDESKVHSQQVSEFSLDASLKEKAEIEMVENKYKTAISVYQKLHTDCPDNPLYAHLYTKAVSCLIVHFYKNKISPFSVFEVADDIDKATDSTEIDVEVFYELQKNDDGRSSLKSLIKSLDDRHEIDVLNSIYKLLEECIIRKIEPETFIDAIELDNNENFEKLFKKKDKNKLFNTEITKNLTPLMLSVVSGNYPEEIAEEFGEEVFEKGSEPVLHDYEMTLLMLAAMLGNYEAAEFLISKGVKIDKHNGNGVTALMLALENRHDDVALLLMRKGADVNAKNKIGYSALMIAAAKGLSHVVDYMIRLGVDVNHLNAHGQTALISALRFNHEDIVVSLIAAGTDLNCKDDEGHTPIDYAESVAVTELIRKGARHSQQIKKKRSRKKKKELNAYKRNLLKDEKEVVPGSFPVFVFLILVFITITINVYLLFFSDDRYKMSSQAESAMKQLGSEYCVRFKECRDNVPEHVLNRCEEMGENIVSEYFKYAQSCDTEQINDCKSCIRTLNCEDFYQINGKNLSDYCYECINACKYHQ